MISRITTCPHCSTRFNVSEQITDKTLICPHCLADVDNAGPGSPIRAADINTDVKRHLSAGSIVLAVLIGLCVLGIAIAFYVHRFRDGGEADIGHLFLIAEFFAALEILVSIAIIRGLIRWGISGVRTQSRVRHRVPLAGHDRGCLHLSSSSLAIALLRTF